MCICSPLRIPLKSFIHLRLVGILKSKGREIGYSFDVVFCRIMSIKNHPKSYKTIQLQQVKQKGYSCGRIHQKSLWKNQTRWESSKEINYHFPQKQSKNPFRYIVIIFKYHKRIFRSIAQSVSIIKPLLKQF